MNLSGLSNLFVVVLFVALVLVAVISARVRRGGAEKVTQMPTRAPGPFAWPPSSLSASQPGDGVDVAGMRDEAQIIRGVRASGRGPCWRCSGNRGAKVKYNWTDGPNWYSGFRWEPCGACLATGLALTPGEHAEIRRARRREEISGTTKKALGCIAAVVVLVIVLIVYGAR